MLCTDVPDSLSFSLGGGGCCNWLLLGLVLLIALTGFVLFTLFLLLATANAIVSELLMFASAVGTFTALFTSLTIYVGVLTVAALAIWTTAVMCTFVVLFVTGWIAFAWVVWQVVKNSMDVVKNSLAPTGKAISSMSVLGQLQQVIMLEDHPKLDIPPAPL
ncbi:hypothetical protein CY35_08G058900 [Sphagnum magellanicum]|nr:hypothetical protein CY35_08G058900 [Sphagnum magellanicum]